MFHEDKESTLEQLLLASDGSAHAYKRKISTINWSHQIKTYELINIQKVKLKSPTAVFGNCWPVIRSQQHPLLLLINYSLIINQLMKVRSEYARKSPENAGGGGTTLET